MAAEGEAGNKKRPIQGVFYSERSLDLLLGWEYVHEGSGNDLTSEVFDLFGLEFYETVGQGKEGIIFTALDVFPGVKLGATLADDDVSSRNGLVAEDFDTETLGNRVTAKGG